MGVCDGLGDKGVCDLGETGFCDDVALGDVGMLIAEGTLRGGTFGTEFPPRGDMALAFTGSGDDADSCVAGGCAVGMGIAGVCVFATLGSGREGTSPRGEIVAFDPLGGFTGFEEPGGFPGKGLPPTAT